MAETGREDAAWFAAEVTTLGDRLQGAREAQRMTQQELAQRLGVRLTTVRAWEDDRTEPRGNRLQMLAGLLNVSLGWLLVAEGEGPGAPDDSAPPRPAPPPGAAALLAEVARLRLRAADLAQDVGRVEKQLRNILRQEA